MGKKEKEKYKVPGIKTWVLFLEAALTSLIILGKLILLTPHFGLYLFIYFSPFFLKMKILLFHMPKFKARLQEGPNDIPFKNVCESPLKWQYTIKMTSSVFIYFFFFIFFPLIFVSWRLVTLQYCSGFCHIVFFFF